MESSHYKRNGRHHIVKTSHQLKTLQLLDQQLPGFNSILENKVL